MAMNCLNNAAPLQLPWTNITVSDDGFAQTRGIEIGMGDPIQIISLRPFIYDNDTFVYNAANCGPSSNDSCIGLEGGVFNPKLSHTYALTTVAQWNGSHDAYLESDAYVYFNDKLSFGPFVEYGYPFVMEPQGADASSYLGLGAGSSFLEAAINASAAPSRAFGLWPGSRSTTDPVDGHLIIGGYDASRVQGQFTNFSSYYDCPACVQVTKMTYNDANGSTSLFPHNVTYLDIAIQPYSRYMELPQSMFDIFGTATGAEGFNPSYGLFYNSTTPPTGNITISIYAGAGHYQTTILAEELFVYPRLFDSSGVYSISNTSVVLAEFYNDTTANYLPNWGIPFLTSNYLIVDFDNDVFRLAPTIPKDTTGSGTVEKLCSGTGPASTTTPPPTHSPTGPVHSPTPTPTPKPSHTGAIAGGVVGGVLGLAILAGLIFCLMRRGGKRREADAAAAAASERAQTPHTEKRNAMSTYTDTTRTEHELPSPSTEHQGVNKWLSGHEAGAHGEKMYANITEPVEMPVEYHGVNHV